MKADKNRDRRFRAEGHLKSRPDSSGLRGLSADELIHELRVHQVELEMQNEELRRAQIELEKARDQYRDLYDTAPLAYYTLDLEGMITDANPAGAALLGTGHEELLASGFSRFVAGSSQNEFRAIRARAANTDVQQNCELELVRPDGTDVTVYAAIVQVANPAGGLPVRLLARNAQASGRTPTGPFLLRMALTDVTELRQAERILHESEEWFRRAFDDSGVGKLLTELDGRLLRVNRAFAAMLGYTVEELQSTDLTAVAHPDDVAANREALVRLQSGADGIARFEKRYLHKNGSVVWVDLGSVLLRDADGKPHHLVADAVSINERKLAEAELAKYRVHLEELVAARTRELTAAQEQLVLQGKLAMVGRVAGSVAHELRNPLGAIRNASYFLQTTAAGKLEGKQLRHLQIIDEYVDRANQVISMILDFTWHLRGEPRKCAVELLLDRAVAEASIHDAVSIHLDVNPSLPDLFVDDRQILAVFHNLFANAAQAMPVGGTIRVSARRKGSMIAIDVADTGSGIKPEHIAQIFEPLFTTKDIGIGLGLAICKAFVESNKGTVSLVSEVGEGTTFTILLPTAEEHLKALESRPRDRRTAEADRRKTPNSNAETNPKLEALSSRNG